MPFDDDMVDDDDTQFEQNDSASVFDELHEDPSTMALGNNTFTLDYNIASYQQPSTSSATLNTSRQLTSSCPETSRCMMSHMF